MRDKILNKWLSRCYDMHKVGIPDKYMSYLHQAMIEYSVRQWWAGFLLGVVATLLASLVVRVVNG